MSESSSSSSLQFGRTVPDGYHYIFVKGLGMKLRRKPSQNKQLNRLRQALQRSKNGKFQSRAQEALSTVARSLKMDPVET